MDTVCVGMSGGVDSSVAAALLVWEGFHVIGIMLRLWSEEGTLAENQCCSSEAVDRARRVAAKLGIPFYVLDARNTFRKKIVEYFLENHKKGLTPNPCYLCNQKIRWGVMLENAFAMGAQYLATGHYARLLFSDANEIELHKAVDPHKDQAYILSGLTLDQLSHTKFPLGGLEKSEVRILAGELNLAAMETPDSQDLCFLGSLDQTQFISKYAPGVMEPGDITFQDGTVIGKHPGLANFTIGQRKGIKIPDRLPYYVIEKDAPRNRLIVGSKNDLKTYSFAVENVNWLKPQDRTPLSVSVVCRYHGTSYPASVNRYEKDGNLRVDLVNPVDNVSPGQIAVFFDNDRVVGSGIIYKKLMKETP